MINKETLFPGSGNKKIILGVIVVVVLLIIVGVIFLSSRSKVSQDVNNTTSPVIDELGVEELSVLVDDSSASSEEKKERYKLAEKVGLEGDTIEIRNCLGQPVVLEAKISQPMFFINKDTKEHNIKIGAKSFILKPDTLTPANPDFGNGKGLYGYFCDNSNQTNGMILVK